MIKDNNYYQISGWMVNKLGLKGYALHAYAIIYGFSQDGQTKFTGSVKYLSDWLGTSRQTTMTTLKTLVEKGYIHKYKKEINGVVFNSYAADLMILNNDSSYGSSLEHKEQLEHVEQLALIPDQNTQKQNKKSGVESKKSISQKISVFKDYAKDDTELLNLLSDFEEMRKSTGTKMTDRAKVLLVNKLERDFPTREQRLATLEQSIERSYRSIFPVDNKKPANKAIDAKGYEWGVQGVDFL